MGTALRPGHIQLEIRYVNGKASLGYDQSFNTHENDPVALFSVTRTSKSQWVAENASGPQSNGRPALPHPSRRAALRPSDHQSSARRRRSPRCGDETLGRPQSSMSSPVPSAMATRSTDWTALPDDWRIAGTATSKGPARSVGCGHASSGWYRRSRRYSRSSQPGPRPEIASIGLTCHPRLHSPSRCCCIRSAGPWGVPDGTPTNQSKMSAPSETSHRKITIPATESQ
jgi:hypothetical protein